MLYWERRRNRTVHQKTLPAAFATHARPANALAVVELVPFPGDSIHSPEFTPCPPALVPSPSTVPPPILLLADQPCPARSRELSSSLSGDTQTAGPVASPVTPPISFGPENERERCEQQYPQQRYGMTGGRAGQLFYVIPKSPTTSLYQPFIIPGRAHKRQKAIVLTLPPAPGARQRRILVHLSVFLLSLFLLVSVLMIVAPIDNDKGATGTAGSADLQPLFQISFSPGKNTEPVWSQVATATAVTQDGYDQGSQLYSLVNTRGLWTPTANAPLDHFLAGQCTYWASWRYHQLTGHWVSWSGNAYQWADQALSSGWIVANTPNPHGASIIVVQPAIAGAGGYGHVGVVEHVNSDGSVYTSNWNWDGNWHRTTYVTFEPQSGISFIWQP